MRILLLNQFFWPDSAATSQLLTDLARGLAGRGHEVYAICADGAYAPQDFDDPPPVHIQRLQAIPFVHGKLGRLLSYCSFLPLAALQALRLPRPDLVITLTTPPLISTVGTLLKKLCGARHFIWEMDVYPDVAVDLNCLKRGGLVHRLTGWLADTSRKRCDGILALGACMRERLAGRGVSKDKIYIAENWADKNLIRAQPLRFDCGRLRLLYSGNLGLAHDVETLRDGMAELEPDGRFRFVFAGGGPARGQLEDWCRKRRLRHVEFRSYSARVDLGESLGSGDVGLVTQRSCCLGSVVPSKLYGLMAAARPILFIGPAQSTAAELVRRFRCGWQVDNGDVRGLTELLRFLAAHRSEVIDAGNRARRAFLRYYDRELGVARICNLIGASVEQEAPEFLAARAAGRS